MKKTIYIVLLILVLLFVYFLSSFSFSEGGSAVTETPITQEILIDIKNVSQVEQVARTVWTSIEDETMKIDLTSINDVKFYETKDVPGEVIQNLENFSTYVSIKFGNVEEWYKVSKISNQELQLINLDTNKKLLLKK